MRDRRPADVPPPDGLASAVTRAMLGDAAADRAERAAIRKDRQDQAAHVVALVMFVAILVLTIAAAYAITRSLVS